MFIIHTRILCHALLQLLGIHIKVTEQVEYDNAYKILIYSLKGTDHLENLMVN
jgi:hypothetical protein